jgi:hypothetical protein
MEIGLHIYLSRAPLSKGKITLNREERFEPEPFPMTQILDD